MYFRGAVRPYEELPETDARKMLAQRVTFQKSDVAEAALRELEREVGVAPPKSAYKKTNDFWQHLELGLRVPPSWWERMRANGELKERAKTEAYTDKPLEDGVDSTELVIATLPYFEFGEYYGNSDLGSLEGLQRFNEEGRTKDRMLALNGWKREGGYLEHRYFTVSHERI